MDISSTIHNYLRGSTWHLILTVFPGFNLSLPNSPDFWDQRFSPDGPSPLQHIIRCRMMNLSIFLKRFDTQRSTDSRFEMRNLRNRPWAESEAQNVAEEDAYGMGWDGTRQVAQRMCESWMTNLKIGVILPRERTRTTAYGLRWDEIRPYAKEWYHFHIISTLIDLSQQRRFICEQGKIWKGLQGTGRWSYSNTLIYYHLQIHVKFFKCRYTNQTPNRDELQIPRDHGNGFPIKLGVLMSNDYGSPTSWFPNEELVQFWNVFVHTHVFGWVSAWRNRVLGTPMNKGTGRHLDFLSPTVHILDSRYVYFHGGYEVWEEAEWGVMGGWRVKMGWNGMGER